MVHAWWIHFRRRSPRISDRRRGTTHSDSKRTRISGSSSSRATARSWSAALSLSPGHISVCIMNNNISRWRFRIRLQKKVGGATVLQLVSLYFQADGLHAYLHIPGSILSTSSWRTTIVSALRSAFFRSNSHAQSTDSHLMGSLGAELVQDSQMRCVLISRFSLLEIRRSSSGMVV